MGTIYKSGIPYSGGGGGSFLPNGGTTGQALVKKSDANQDVEWKNVGSGGGAEFSIDSASNSGMVGQGNDYFSVNLNGEDTVDLSLIQPNVYSKIKTVPTKEYVDSKAGGGSITYSTDEQAVGTWIDGKTIYQKTITCAMPTDIVDGTIKNTYVPHGVSNIAQIVGCESVSKAMSGNVGGEDGNMSVGNTFTYISADSYQINLSANISEYSSKEYFVTFKYTKTI